MSTSSSSSGSDQSEGSASSSSSSEAVSTSGSTSSATSSETEIVSLPADAKVEGNVSATKGPLWNRKAPVSWKDSVFISLTFTNCCVGAGLLAIGKMFSTLGVGMVAIMATVAFSYAIWSLVYLTGVNFHGNFTTLRETSEKLYGRFLAIISDVSVVFCNVGYLCSYITVSADYIRDGIYQLGHVEAMGKEVWRKLFKVFVAIGIMFPLSLFRSLGVLNFVSSFSFIFSLIAVIAVTVRYAQWQRTGIVGGINHPKPETPVWPEGVRGWTGTIAYIPFMFCILTIHACITPIQHELRVPGGASGRKKTTLMGVVIAVIITILMYVLVGIEGALMFDRSCTEEQTQNGCIQINSNIMLNFTNDTPLSIIKLLYAIVIIVSFPCMLYPVRTSICEWFGIDKFNGKTDNPNITKEERKMLGTTKRNGYAWFILAGAIVIAIDTVLAIFIPNIDRILSIATNIFGIILFEVLYIMYWHRGKLITKYSIGRLLDVKAENEGLFKKKKQMIGGTEGTEKTNNNISMSLEDSGESEQTEHNRPSAFERYKQIRRSSIGDIETSKKYSVIVAQDEQEGTNNSDSKDEFLAEYNKKTNGERVFEEEKSEDITSEDLPKMGSSSSTSSENKHQNDSPSISSSKDRDKEDDNPVTKRNSELVIKTQYDNILNSKKSSIIEVEGDAALSKKNIIAIVEFPHVNKEKHKEPLWKNIIFYTGVVLFSCLNIAATVCDIYGWATYG